jgi:hypothetical protein
VSEKTPKNTALASNWKPGQSGNPNGRPKGSRNKLGEAFISALHDDFIANGEKVIETVRAEKPDAYLKVIASILPKQFELDGNLLTKFTDEQLGQLVAALDAWVQANGDAGITAPEGRDPASPLSPVH